MSGSKFILSCFPLFFLTGKSQPTLEKQFQIERESRFLDASNSKILVSFSFPKTSDANATLTDLCITTWNTPDVIEGQKKCKIWTLYSEKFEVGFKEIEEQSKQINATILGCDCFWDIKEKNGEIRRQQNYHSPFYLIQTTGKEYFKLKQQEKKGTCFEIIGHESWKNINSAS